MAKSLGEIAELLKHTKFKRKWFGGVDEEDVWEKLGRLQAEYSELIEENDRKHDASVDQLKERAASLEGQLQKQGESPRPSAATPGAYARLPVDGTGGPRHGRG